MQRKLLFLLAITGAIALGLYSYQSMHYDFKTLNGDTYQWRELQGQWVVVNYFAQWCAPCLREIPELNQYHADIKAKQGIKLFGISYDRLDNNQLKAIKQRYAIDFPLITGEPAWMPNTRPRQLPCTYIINPQGQVAKQLLGEQSRETLLHTIASLKGA